MGQLFTTKMKPDTIIDIHLMIHYDNEVTVTLNLLELQFCLCNGIHVYVGCYSSGNDKNNIVDKYVIIFDHGSLWFILSLFTSSLTIQ